MITDWGGGERACYFSLNSLGMEKGGRERNVEGGGGSGERGGAGKEDRKVKGEEGERTGEDG